MKKTVIVPFASGVEILGYKALMDRRNLAAQEFSSAAGEISKRSETPIPEGSGVRIIGNGLEFSWEETKTEESLP